MSRLLASWGLATPFNSHLNLKIMYMVDFKFACKVLSHSKLRRERRDKVKHSIFHRIQISIDKSKERKKTYAFFISKGYPKDMANQLADTCF